MLETLAILPFSFWVAALLLLAGAVWAVARIRDGIGLPVLVLLGTVAAWYVGDAFYNDYPHNHAQLFTPDILSNAWWQVALFVLAFLVLTPAMHGWMNGPERQRPSQVFRLIQSGAGDPQFQNQLNQMFWGILIVWLMLVAVAWIRLGDQIWHYFFPFVGYRADPWGRGRIGTGFDAVWALAAYLQMFLAAMFGLTAALARDGSVRTLAMIGCCLAWPFYIFDRTRNTLLAVVVPAILAWVFIRLRGGWWQKMALLAVCFAIINAWLAFVIANRSNASITEAVHAKGEAGVETDAGAHHEGLNMFEELCWENTFIQNGTYEPNWGRRYFAEIVNPIPRSLWHGKPMIGIDYAEARGFAEGGHTDESGVNTTISTGMIGQGVVNFGPVLGPAFAAWLMALWAALLARLDLRGEETGNISLYALGMILTFNLGRDITLITLYTFFFGMILVWWVRRRTQGPASRARRARGGVERKRIRPEKPLDQIAEGGVSGT